MRVLFSEIVGLPVYAPNRRLTAVVKNVIMDCEKGKILALCVHPGKNNVILPMDFQIYQNYITLFDDDAVLDFNDVVRLKNIIPELYSFLGLPVFTEKGKKIGHVKDFELDSESMTMTAFSSAKELCSLNMMKEFFRVEIL